MMADVGSNSNSLMVSAAAAARRAVLGFSSNSGVALTIVQNSDQLLL
jgi:hypothetical protein